MKKTCYASEQLPFKGTRVIINLYFLSTEFVLSNSVIFLCHQHAVNVSDTD